MAKSEVFENIHGLFKQNLKSCNARAAKATPENDEKTKICVISKKATLHVQHTFFEHFFAVALQNYNVKLPSYTF